MGLFPYPLSPLYIGSLGTIEDEEREEGGMHETATAEEEGAEFGVLAFPTVGGVKEPDRGINANAESAERGRGGRRRGTVEAVL